MESRKYKRDFLLVQFYHLNTYINKLLVLCHTNNKSQTLEIFLAEIDKYWAFEADVVLASLVFELLALLMVETVEE